ncbi:MAG: NADH-quinone oxidoreductase subunit L [Candidatus Bathyarchaeota archaeon]|nr:NADH-quinone oxidoreductase subunit L [Candidatus Bathyarchaeota archaeon A05DMB-5]MDH7558282.1 NADH-quinone oxidoreductase subunit L [Candidatus Bathyarchaeota archaeon]
MLPYAPWLVWIVPTISSLFIPIIARLGGKAREYFAVTVSLVATIFAFSMVPDVYFGALASPDMVFPWIPSMSIDAGVFVDSLSVLFANLVAFFSFVVIIYSIGYMAGEENLTRYYFFMLLFMGSMIGLVMSDNFLQMFIFWEMVGLCSYSLVSFWYRRPESVRAGVKVFLMTRIGDVCLLAAIALLYTSLGSFSFSYTIKNIRTVPLPMLTAVAFLMLGGAIAKSAQLPLHTWLYTAMEAPTSVSALLHGATMVKAGVYLIARLFILFGSVITLIPLWLSCVAWIGAITAFIGATLALYTPDIKGVPAYSTISQIGFMIAALGAASSPSSLGWFAGLFHMLSHAFFQGLGFLTIGGIIHMLGTRDMRQMGGLRKAMPITFLLCIVVMLARTGVPPFASFFSKGFIISSLWSTGDVLLVLTIYASTAVTFAYTLRFIILTFLREPSEHVKKTHLHEPPKTMLFASGILAVLCFAWGFLGPLIGNFMHVGVEMGLSEVFSSATLIFLLILFAGGFPIYITYYKKSESIEKIKGKLLTPLILILEHGYFFDTFYEKVVARSVLLISVGLKRVETTFFNRLPYLVASEVMSLAHNTQKYLDIFADELLYMATNKTLASASKIKRMRSGSLQHYIAAALIGFLIILILIIITMLR